MSRAIAGQISGALSEGDPKQKRAKLDALAFIYSDNKAVAQIRAGQIEIEVAQANEKTVPEKNAPPQVRDVEIDSYCEATRRNLLDLRVTAERLEAAIEDERLGKTGHGVGYGPIAVQLKYQLDSVRTEIQRVALARRINCQNS
jgi:hypothetical protein